MPQSARTSLPDDNQTTAGQKPVEKFNDGPIHVSIWENNGTKGAFRTASFELRYRNREEKWQTGRSYSTGALKHLESAAREARTRIETWQQAHGAKPSPR